VDVLHCCDDKIIRKLTYSKTTIEVDDAAPRIARTGVEATFRRLRRVGVFISRRRQAPAGLPVQDERQVGVMAADDQDGRVLLCAQSGICQLGRVDHCQRSGDLDDSVK